MHSQSSPLLNKHKNIHKYRHTQSNNRIGSNKMHSLTNNFLKILRDISQPAHPRPTNPLISFLNLFQQKKLAVSNSYIPSIENMLSEQNIDGQNELYSKSSIQRGFSDEIISQNSYQMHVLYICLLDKIMKHLHHNTSQSQRRKIIRGTWNILIKYCKDNNYKIFGNIGPKIQWGLLQLVNFNFNTTPKDKYLAERRLIETKYPGSQNSICLQ